jgi:hypothetical protein
MNQALQAHMNNKRKRKKKKKRRVAKMKGERGSGYSENIVLGRP